MSTEQVSFLAGKDALGGKVWLQASVEDREQRDDGEWLYLLPAFSDSEDAARWVKNTEVRWPQQQSSEQRGAETQHGVESPRSPVHLHVVK